MPTSEFSEDPPASNLSNSRCSETPMLAVGYGPALPRQYSVEFDHQETCVELGEKLREPAGPLSRAAVQMLVGVFVFAVMDGILFYFHRPMWALLAMVLQAVPFSLLCLRSQERSHGSRELGMLERLDNCDEATLGICMTAVFWVVIAIVAFPWGYGSLRYLRQDDFNSPDSILFNTAPLALYDFDERMRRAYPGNSTDSFWWAVAGDDEASVRIDRFRAATRTFTPPLNTVQAQYAFQGLDCDQSSMLDKAEFVRALALKNFYECEPPTTTTPPTTSTTITTTPLPEGVVYIPIKVTHVDYSKVAENATLNRNLKDAVRKGVSGSVEILQDVSVQLSALKGAKSSNTDGVLAEVLVTPPPGVTVASVLSGLNGLSTPFSVTVEQNVQLLPGLQGTQAQFQRPYHEAGDKQTFVDCGTPRQGVQVSTTFANVDFADMQYTGKYTHAWERFQDAFREALASAVGQTVTKADVQVAPIRHLSEQHLDEARSHDHPEPTTLQALVLCDSARDASSRLRQDEHLQEHLTSKVSAVDGVSEYTTGSVALVNIHINDVPWSSEITTTVVEYRHHSTSVTTTTTVLAPTVWVAFQDNEYLLVEELATWEDQYNKCEALGALMVTIHSAAENAFVAGMMPTNGAAHWKRLWIGISKTAWIDGSDVDYENWAVSHQTLPCGELLRHTGDKWADADCSRKARSICKKAGTQSGDQLASGGNPLPQWLVLYRQSLPAGETAAVQIDFQEINFKKLTTRQKSLIRRHLVETLASLVAFGGMTSNVEDLSDTPVPGSVTLSPLEQASTRFKHVLVADCRVILPLDMSIDDARRKLSNEKARRRIVDAIKDTEGLQGAIATGDPWNLGLPAVAVGMSGKDQFLKIDQFHFMNNFLELAEFRHAAKTFIHPPIIEESDVEELFKRLDANGDEHLDPDEFYGRYNKRHFPLDKKPIVGVADDALSISDATPRRRRASHATHGEEIKEPTVVEEAAFEAATPRRRRAPRRRRSVQATHESSADSKCGGPYAQCGGSAWYGATCCKTGCSCVKKNRFYSNCKPPKGFKFCDREADWDDHDSTADTDTGATRPAPENAVACIDNTDCESHQECVADVCQAATERRRRTPPRRRRQEALLPTDAGYKAALNEACLESSDCGYNQVCADDKCQAVGGRRLAHKAGGDTDSLRG